jgi:hypothetical protein
MRESRSSSANPFEDIASDLAVELLGTAMRDSEAPILQIAGALARINVALGSSKDGQLQDDIALCIQGLQFHDRLIQQLTTVRSLIGSEPILGTLSSGFMPTEGTVELF